MCYQSIFQAWHIVVITIIITVSPLLSHHCSLIIAIMVLPLLLVTVSLLPMWCCLCCHIVAVSSLQSCHCGAFIVTLSWCHHRWCIVAVPLLLHRYGFIVAITVSLSQCHLCHRIVVVLLLQFHHHHRSVTFVVTSLQCHHCSFIVTITIASLQCHIHCCGVTVIVMVLQSSLWYCSHCCSVAFIVMVSGSSLHCCGVELIGTAERAVTAKPEALRMGALAFWATGHQGWLYVVTAAVAA